MDASMGHIPQLGAINGHMVGRFLKETMLRAFGEINAVRLNFEIHEKEGYGGKMDDLFTNADKNAQEVYVRALLECTDWGVLGEEDHLRIEPRNGSEIYATVDPVDGTKAYARESSTGVGTMIAVVHGDEVLSAYIGDTNTREIYGYRPGSNKVHRIFTALNAWKQLPNPVPKELAKSYLLMRDPPERYGRRSRALLPLFKNYEINGGSIGIWFARLWKGEVGGVLLPTGTETPWDSSPVIGICRKLGYEFLRPKGSGWEVFHLPIPREPTKRKHDVLVVHGSNLPQIPT